MRRAGQSGDALGDAGVEDDDTPGFEFAIERIENAGSNQFDGHERRRRSLARDSHAKPATFKRGMPLLVLRPAVMMRMIIAMLMDGMLAMRALFMRERRVFELNERSFPRPTDDKGGDKQCDENRTLECAHDWES